MKNISFCGLVGDPTARGAFFLYGGALFHFLYAVFRLVTGILYRQYRIDTAVLFYLSLALNRFLLIRAYRKESDEVAVRRACRASGKLLFITAGIMLLLISETVAGGRRIHFPRGFLFVSGTYALFGAISALLELFFLKRLHTPLLSASRTVGLLSALISSFNFLEDLLASSPIFGENVRRTLLLTVGAAILLLVLFLAVGFWQKGKENA